MHKYHIRTVRTASKAKAVQVVWYKGHTTKIAKHIGSAKNEDELAILHARAEQYISENNPQLSLFDPQLQNVVLFDHIEATSVSHKFAREVLLKLAGKCALGSLDILYCDLAIMRIIEPSSKLRSIELIERYFGICYTRYLYERLPKLLDEKLVIEEAAVKTAKSFKNAFALLLYDVTTLYFETHKPDDDLQARGFSKDDKSKQPQIVIGLLVTAQGFPLVQEVFKGNTFEGHTMLSIVKSFQERYDTGKPVIVADAAMLSKENQNALAAEGHHYIVGARLANAKSSLISSLCSKLPKHDGAILRMEYPNSGYDIVCTYSHARYKKEKREFDKQVERAKMLIARQEPGKRAKFIKKSGVGDKPYIFDETLRQKSEQLLGIKGCCTNVSEDILSNDDIVSYYHDLWRIEQAFRISKSDLRSRPIFHYSHDAIRAHVLTCFMALMISKFIEIKAGLSIRRFRDMIWQVHDINLRDTYSGRERLVRTPITSELREILASLEIMIENTH
jgi:transposase